MVFEKEVVYKNSLALQLYQTNQTHSFFLLKVANEIFLFGVWTTGVQLKSSNIAHSDLFLQNSTPEIFNQVL